MSQGAIRARFKKRGTQVTSNHYVAKDSPEEVRNDLIKLRKKVGIF